MKTLEILLKAKISNFELFNNLIKHLKCFSSRGNIYLSNEGIRYYNIEQSHIAIIDCMIPKDFFTEYNYYAKELSILSLDYELFSSKLDLIPKTNSIELNIYQKEDDTVARLEFSSYGDISTTACILFSSNQRSLLKRSCHVYSTSIKIPYNLFKSVLDIVSLDEYLEFIVSADKRLLFKSGNSGNFNPDIKRSDVEVSTELIDITGKSDISSVYCINYLRDMFIFDFDDINDRIYTIRTGSNSILKIKTKFNHISYAGLLAPKIEDEKTIDE